MKTFPGLMLAATLLWGWQGHHLLLALLLGALQEGAQWLGRRAPLTLRAAALQQAALVASGAALLLLIWLWSNDNPREGLPLIAWSPLAALPLALYVLRTQGDGIARSMLDGKPQAHGAPPLYPGPLWLGWWLLAAGASSHQGVWFYPAACLISAFALWPRRPARVAPALLMLALAAACGLGVQLGLQRLQGHVEEWAMRWMMRQPEDGLRSQTALGHIGALHLSDDVVLLLRAKRLPAGPVLLQQASYNVYQDTVWKLSGNNSYRDVPAGPQPGAWRLHSATPQNDWQIQMWSGTAQVLLPLPPASQEIRLLEQSTPWLRLSRNPLGSLQAVLPQNGYLHYSVQSGMHEQGALAPGPKDMQLPEREQALLRQLAQELGLAQLPPAQRLAHLQAWFARQFRYSTWRSDQHGMSPLADFLQRARTGHCEHFASAGALLLRASGLPARYITGYSAQEEDWLGQGLLVRQRHAHAWVKVFYDGHWRDFDPTPPDWNQATPRSNWEWWNSFWFSLKSAWQESHVPLWLWAVLPLPLLWLLWRRRAGAGPQQTSATQWRASTPPALLQALQTCLQDIGLGRPPHESLQAWGARIASALPPDCAAQLQALLHSYSQARYGAAQNAAGDWEQACQAWLARWREALYATAANQG
ncbi:DUF4129 domain-containing transglutaminase family protein [Massilia sp. W12]|uniref:DUF4129 domain-containing transglutaminase family protein n=1 Tax=Massilia sp. W12 TaxID=3126507 RepID=UPI0030D1F3AB